VPVFEHGEEQFIRLSFQGYNDAGDLERLRDALAALV
jgi:selenocysteine lyase/cysteine desulfurase